MDKLANAPKIYNPKKMAKKVIAEYTPPFASFKEFLDFQDSLCSSGDRITYTEDNAEIRL